MTDEPAGVIAETMEEDTFLVLLVSRIKYFHERVQASAKQRNDRFLGYNLTYTELRATLLRYALIPNDCFKGRS